jgi:iron complex outermembrane recepter protein
MRRGLLATTIIAGCWGIVPAYAQSAPADAADMGDAIIVTGSRIANPAATSASPLQVVDSRAIAASGVTNIQDILLQNPAFGTPSISRTNSAFASASAGVATVDLRNLGVDRTLVLVNGRRFVSGVPGSNAVDLNVIPTQFLERVDVLTGGASAVYGSDAVAGVVNFIYKSKFQGVEVGGQVGISSRGDGFDRELNLLVGTNFADGRGNIMAFGGYSKEGTVFKRDRSTEVGSSAGDRTSSGAGPTRRQNSPIGPFLSGFSPRGRYYTDNFTFTYDPITNALRPCTSTNGGICNAPGTPFNGQAIGPDGFNRSAFRYLALPVERYVGALRANFEVSSALNFFLEGNYARTQVRTNIEPFPLASDDVNAETGGQIAIESLVGGILYRNPFVPDDIFNDSSDTDGDGLRDIFFDKRLTDFGPRASDVKRDTFRLAGGADGKIFGNFSYEVYGVYGETKEDQTGSGQFNSLNFRQALNAIRDVNDIDRDGNVTEIICVDSVARAGGCVPANIYGVGSLAPAVGYLAAPQQLKTKVTQAVAGASISGGLFSIMGADPIGVAIGVEYRRETSSSVFDALSQAGLNGGNALPSTSGAIRVYEGYGEAIIPILQDRPFFNKLSLRGAIRASDYSTVGQTLSYNYGGEWAPIEDVRFRVIQARSVRAPNVSELFAPPQQDFPSGLQDPCTGVTATSTTSVSAACRAAPGVNANIVANGGVFTVSQADLQGITSFAGGNPFLQEEKGDSFTAGVVITPKSLGGVFRNLVVTVDYFDIKIRDAIVSTPLQFILDQCYNGGDQSLCNFIKRRPAAQGANNAGSLDEVNSGGSNSGGTRTSGIDAVVNWRGRLLGGDLGVRASYTRVIKGFDIPLPGSDRDEFAGEIGASKNRFTTSLSLDNDNGVGATFTGTYIGVAYLNDQLTGAAPGNPAYRVSPQFYLDGQIRFKVAKKFEFYVGGDNLLDNKPPFLADIGASTGQDTDAGTYDALGRRFYVGARIKI